MVGGQSDSGSALTSAFIFDRTFFVHGGIPRDRTFKEHFTDLASLNHPDLRFEMMWSDPSTADVVTVGAYADMQLQIVFADGRMTMITPVWSTDRPEIVHVKPLSASKQAGAGEGWPERYWSMARAARFPAPMASMTVAAPVTMSPPA